MEKKRVRGASTSTSSSSASSALLPLLLLLLLSPLLNIASWHHTASVSIFPYCLNQLVSTLSLTRLSHSQFQNPKESPRPTMVGSVRRPLFGRIPWFGCPSVSLPEH